MTVKPIPAELLTDSFTLCVPAESGYSETLVTDVRAVRFSAAEDYTSKRVRDNTSLVIYYDCENSSPEGLEFAAGQSVLFGGERFEITEAKLFGGFAPHHFKLFARKTG